MPGAETGYGTLANGVLLGGHWQELDAEGRSYQLHGKLPTALKTLNKAAADPSGCGWAVFAHRAECHLRLLDSTAALQDASQALDMQRKAGAAGASSIGVQQTACDALWREAELEEALLVVARLCARKRGGRMAGDEHAQRMEGIRGDIGKAMGPSVGRVLRRDILRAMMVKKGIDSNNPMAGPRHSWVGPGYGTMEPVWRGGGEEAQTTVPLPLPLSWGATHWKKEERHPEEDDEGRVQSEEQDEDTRRWGWMRQIPGHDHVCADPLIANQADRIAELRELGLLEKDRAYLLHLLDLLKVDMERPGESSQVESGCTPCPGPNLDKWRDEQLRADASNDEYCDPLAASKWEAQDACRKSLEDIKKYVANRLRIRARYQHGLASRGPRPSPGLRAARDSTRKKRASSTVRFMMRRVHECLRLELYRDADSVGERLVSFLERLPCHIFPDRLHALARTLDCRAVVATRRNNIPLAVEMQKKRCQVAVDHGLPDLYARALEELALLLFSMADYPQAEASWTERVGLRSKDLREKAQALFQLARCCFVQGYLRMMGKVGASSAGRGDADAVAGIRKDHRHELPEYSLGSKPGEGAAKRQSVAAESEAEPEDPYRWRDSDVADEWTPDMYCGGTCVSVDDEDDDEAKVKIPTVAELKPTSVEACLRIIMIDFDTQDPLGDCGDLICMERFPDPEDAGRNYPLMPPDFNPAHNVMNAQFELFEKHFREACQYFVGVINGKEDVPEKDIQGEKASDELEPPDPPSQTEAGRSREGTLEGSLDHIPEAEEDEHPPPPPET